MIEKINLYLLTLLVYLPWLIYAIQTKKISKFPVISFCFLGLFVFNAIGSVFIIFPSIFDRKDFFSHEYILMLNLQIVIFYGLTSIYFFFRCSQSQNSKKLLNHKSTNSIFRYFLLGMLSVYLTLFFIKVGSPPLLKIISGSFDSFSKLINYRTETIYSGMHGNLPKISLYFLPMFTAIYIFIEGYVTHKKNSLNYILVGGCILIFSLTGGKGNLIEIAVSLGITYIIVRHYHPLKEKNKLPYKQICLWLVLLIIPTMWIYRTYLSMLHSSDIFLGKDGLLYRIIGVYSESMAATVIYVQKNGFLEGNTFPSRISSLIPNYQPIDLHTEMYKFIFGGSGGASVPACAEAYINFGWIGFIYVTSLIFVLVILIQELLLRMPTNVFSLSLMAIYSYFAIAIAQTTLFGYLLSFTFTIWFIFMFFVRAFIYWLCSDIIKLKHYPRSDFN